MNHGLGTIYIKDGGSGRWLIPPVSNGLVVWPNRSPIFHDEHGIGGQVGRIVNISHGGKQHEWFSPYLGKGITKTGMGRLNRSVEAFVYCIVGAEVNVRTSIVDSGGGGQETQQEMLKLFEEAVMVEDIASGVQRYQLVIQEAKLRLDFAIAPGIWLIPSNLIINTESVIGYNNFLQKANKAMTFGQNETVNEATHSVGLKHNLGNKKKVLPTLKTHPVAVEPKLKAIAEETIRRVDENKIPNPVDSINHSDIESKFDGGTVDTVKTADTGSHENQIAMVGVAMGIAGYFLFK